MSALGFRGKFILGAVLLVVAVNLAAGLYLERQLRESTTQRVEAELERHAEVTAAVINSSNAPWTPGGMDAVADELAASAAARVTVVDADGTVLGDSALSVAEVHDAPSHADRPEIVAAISGRGERTVRRHSDTLDHERVYVAVPFQRDGRQGAVRVSLPASDLSNAVYGQRLTLFIAGLVSVVTALSLGLGLSGFMARRLGQLSEAGKTMVAVDPDSPSDRDAKTSAASGAFPAPASFTAATRELEHTLTALAGQRDLLKTVLNSMDDGVIATDEARKIRVFNPSAAALLGVSVPNPGKSLLEVVRHPELSDALDMALAGRATAVEMSLHDPKRRLSVRATPRASGEGAVLVLHDVSEIRRLETVRQDFVANVSHELRTPVSIIQANLETLLDGGAMDEPEIARRFLDAVSRNADRLGLLISDLLDISRIDGGRLVLDPVDADVEAIATTVLDTLREKARIRDVTLELQCDPELTVYADPSALEQILVNLVENAIKYGPPGGTVAVSAFEERDEIRIEVIDQGPGIPPEHRPRVFERFYRVDPGRARREGGTGLGLAIVKNLTESMGGRVGVEPREPHGSVFFVGLPYSARTRAISAVAE